MKDCKEYSKNIQKLCRTMKSQPSRHVKFDEPVDALVYAAVSENITEPKAEEAIKKLKDYFVDYNDLRVATIDEITEVLGQDIPDARGIATAIVTLLKAVFEKYNMLSLQALCKLGKRPAKQVLEKFAGATPFIVDYCMLTSLQGHAIPLTPKMIEYLKANSLAHPESTYDEIEGFLARQIPAKKVFDFYYALRHESESARKQKSKKTKSVKKTKK